MGDSRQFSVGLPPLDEHMLHTNYVDSSVRINLNMFRFIKFFIGSSNREIDSEKTDKSIG
ncbi:hypothetical protein SADUNF_Sadunf17G0005500 [Salix dunnii]|uniref:Uncharacterized protein n=1 Tax=Salix dunnii TaxID=1413687 RepID=A0A835J4V9_9ROSI|nr:hypothetical protein SADUNF_Sadunf17G0005500 [Salix dunnii]